MSAPGPTKSSRLLKATSLLNLLVNLVTMGALIGVLVLLARVNSNLDKIQSKIVHGTQEVKIAQGAYGNGPVDVRLVDSQGGGIGTSSLDPIYVRGISS